MRHWINLFETSSPLQVWRDKMIEDNLDMDDDDRQETGIDDLAEMMFDPEGNLFIHRQICFVDSAGWLTDLEPGDKLGLYWSFDAHRATSYDADASLRDCVTIVAKLAPERHGEARVMIEHHEAEVRFDSGTEVTLVALYRNGGRGGELRADLYGETFLT